uniref:Glycerol3phosphate Oacyltransferase putative n=1 Tax=Albugo laibachii Nc14 TaxID=890382 RepID=F0WQ06_9STRA|nr:glycerol3phosphate Oacyltransferase putative [Albugo laibachii Nc14]|eukprot:CCA23410.1 glycerol3phosphate Oacyltransferase putative [Albugo laibachii Nc14]
MKFHKADVLNDVWIQFLALSLLMALSTESLNPVKAISKFLGFPAWYFGVLSFLLMLVLLWSNISDAIYRCVRVYFHSVLSIFFKSIDVIGADNIPLEGPVIFTGNHANQFVDALMVMMNSKRKVGFVIAEKSWHLPVVGPLAKSCGCIPVLRAQDHVIAGQGAIRMDDDVDHAILATEESTSVKEADKDCKSTKREFKLIGQGTSFLKQVTPGDQVRFQGDSVLASGLPIRVLQVSSDSEIYLESPLLDNEQKLVQTPSQYGILKKIDQSKMFSEVYTHLKHGDCIGIFPEGGSHDRTDLLPLKAGVAIMALGVKANYNINALVVPVGLTYFRGHRFRGRAVVEFGPPIAVSDQIMQVYSGDNRKACNDFLHQIEEGMRAVIVTAPSYDLMQLIFTARRLYQRSGIRLSAAETQDLNRRFAEGYKVLSVLPHASKDLDILRKNLQEYHDTLRVMGLKDHQVPYIAWWTYRDVIGSAMYGFLIFALASIPSFVLNVPVGIMARYISRREQQKALASSKVKVTARDVILSKKIVFSSIAIPTLYLLYSLAAIAFTDWYWSSIILLFLSFPLFSFFGVRSVEAGMIELKTILPLLYRLLPKYRVLQDGLPRRRAQLHLQVRDLVKKYEADLGPLVSLKKMDWRAYMRSRPGQACDAKTTEGNGTNCEESSNELEHVPAVQVSPHHDLSFLSGSSKSVIDLAKMEQLASMEEPQDG